MVISEIFALMSIPLNDADMVTYPSDQRMDSLNAGLRALVTVRPDACSGFSDVPLVAGKCRQYFPDYCEQFLDVCYRVVEGSDEEQSVMLVSRQDWDRNDPLWMSETGLVEEVAIDDRLPECFWVWPVPADDRQKLVMAMARPAPVFMVPSGQWTLKQKFIQPVMEYALYWLFSRDSTVVANAQRASGHLNSFTSLLGLDTQTMAALSPVNPDYKQA